ncbi:hypothetical protein LHJ74_33495 [Streptomyces sp. N2-109]|uniref:Uncharacterized protein n=1 Tax=Streptomyces gossypii TaxID=2883101 RepID=A0ABT2K3N7_9ACTN|nr:hypothetical protein [Streptomyces gossypii]MCT2594773.1 hypothetical protein [Streptomyces gossypii]
MNVALRELGSTRRPAPEDVELVACATVDRMSDQEVRSCEYYDGRLGSYHERSAVASVTYYQGKILARVYEVRTTRYIGSVTLKGPDTAKCDSSIRITMPSDGAEADESYDRHILTEPSRKALTRALGDFVAGRPHE